MKVLCSLAFVLLICVHTLDSTELKQEHVDAIISDSLLTPRYLKSAEYPVRANGLSGATALVRVHLDWDGGVRKAKTVYCTHYGYGFEKSAERAAKKSLFEKTDGPKIGYYKWEFLNIGLRLIDSVWSIGQCDYETAKDSAECEVPPDFLKAARPEYPKLCRAAGLEGKVWVKALVDSLGRVNSASLFKSSGYKLLDLSALDAALETEFKPAICKGVPKASWVAYEVKFLLE